MRKVVSPSEVAHFFSNQTQSDARNSGGTFFFEQEKIFSYGYHFCIARFYEGKLLMTKRRYSNTTRKHVNYVWAATRQHDKIMCYYPEDNYGTRNFFEWTKELEASLALLGKARKPENYLRNIKHMIDEIKEYAAHMSFEMPPALSEIVNSEDIENAIMSNAQRIANLERMRRADQRERVKGEVERFRKFEVSRLSSRGGDIDYLRVSEDRGFETSQGVSLSIEEGLRLYMAIKLGKLNPGDKVLHYTVRSIDKKMLVVGCHNIPIKEIDMVIEQNIEILKACAEKLSLAVTFATSISQQQ